MWLQSFGGTQNDDDDDDDDDNYDDNDKDKTSPTFAKYTDTTSFHSEVETKYCRYYRGLESRKKS